MSIRRARRARARGRSSALLSVVVPAYNVEEYLAESLTSILGQSHTSLEVIVVDDGSSDGTGAMADRFAAEDPRLTVVHQTNAGLGAARNVGTRHGTGTYLTFVDSDDLVPSGAYAALVGTLERSGSDLAIGAVERLDGDRRYMMPLMRENHRVSSTSVRLEDAPLMLADCFAWNKVYRRSFWDTAGLSFPEGVRYEDQPTLTRALVEAASFDVLTDSVYLWRVRSDGSSISQQRSDLQDLTDRILTKRWSTDVVRSRTSAATQNVWFARVLPVDMWEYFRAVPGCTDEYWSLLHAGVTEFWSPDTLPFERTALPVRQRLMGWLVAQDRRSDLEELLNFLDENPGPLPLRRVGDQELVVHPFSDLPDLPVELLRQ